MDNTCPIWGLPCQVFRPDADTYVVEGSIRTGGNYQMDVAARMGVGGLSDTEKAQLTSWLIEQRMAGNDWPRITERQVEYAKERMPLPVHERADRLLRYLAKHSPRVGRPLAIVPPTRGIELSIPNISETSESIFENCYSALAWSESTAPGEVGYLTDYLAGMGWITKGTTIQSSTNPYHLVHQVPGAYLCRVEIPGYSRIEEVVTNVDSGRCFVAIWFDSSMNEVYDNAMEPAIKRAGYEPVRIDRQPDLIDKIDDAIVAEIRRSRFLVADFT